MRFRILLPVVYTIVVLVLFLGHAQGAGHGRSLEAIPYISFPAFYLLELIVGMESMSELLLGMLAGFAQYLILGYLIDIAIKRYRRTS